MKLEIEHVLDEIGIDYRYHHFETTEAVSPPFIVWTTPESNNFFADGAVYHTNCSIDIELYTDVKDFELEQQIEAVLNRRGIPWQKSEQYIENENLYEVLYETNGGSFNGRNEEK